MAEVCGRYEQEDGVGRFCAEKQKKDNLVSRDWRVGHISDSAIFPLLAQRFEDGRRVQAILAQTHCPYSR